MLGAVEPVCEASRETRQELRRLEEIFPTREKGDQQTAVFDKVLAKYPDNVFLHERYQRFAYELAGGTKSALRPLIEYYKDLFAKNPEKKEYAYLYATVLVDTDTPQAIEGLKKIISSPPPFPWAHRELSLIYSRGNFANVSEARAQLVMFHRLCPASLDRDALALLERYATPETAGQYAAPLRERLTKETDVNLLEAWNSVWSLEFKAHPQAEHAQVRKQVAADLTRLGRLPESAALLSFLADGYEILGDKAQVLRIQKRLLAEYPDSEQTAPLIGQRWQEGHPTPNPGDPEEKKQAFYRAQLEWAEERLKKSPNNFAFLNLRFRVLVGLANSTPGQIAAAGELMRNGLRDGSQYGIPPYEFQIARGYLKHKINVNQVPMLVDSGLRTYGEGMGSFRWHSDREIPDEHARRAEQKLAMNTEGAEILLEAAQQLKKPEIARSAVEALADAIPAKPDAQARLWCVKAAWAEMDGRKLDALLMYHAALKGRSADSKSTDDDAAANFGRLWSELGGSEAGKALLAARLQNLSASTDGKWEKRDGALPPWELSDLNGKTWKLVSLAGKRLLINVWASWCGPCRLEHPYLQKLYERYKGQPDFEIITFNVDDRVGAIAPYMSENKYTFPVLLAGDHVAELLVSSGIPRNWIVDGEGKLEWEQIGFAEDENWDKIILEKLSKTKTH